MEDFIKNENKYMYRMLQLIIIGPLDNLSNAKSSWKLIQLRRLKVTSRAHETFSHGTKTTTIS